MNWDLLWWTEICYDELDLNRVVITDAGWPADADADAWASVIGDDG
jgi:hypothetical protein